MAIDLIDPNTVRKFIAVVHERAAAAIYGLRDPRPAVLHLCSMSPDDKRFYTSAYNVGDTERMTRHALIDAEAGKNVFVEPRLVRASARPNERGGLYDTQAVFAAVGDSDSDTGKPFTPRTTATAVIETSPGNDHSWFFLKHAIGAADAQELGQLMRQACGGDHCTGNCVQPFRLAGTPNYPNTKKIARGRIVVPTRILRITDRTYTAAELREVFAEPRPSPRQQKDVITSVGYSRMKVQALLSAGPGDDRSAAFFSAINHAVIAGVTPDQFEELCREFPYGCAGKYLGHRDRLREEIERCYGKIANEKQKQ